MHQEVEFSVTTGSGIADWSERKICIWSCSYFVDNSRKSELLELNLNRQWLNELKRLNNYTALGNQEDRAVVELRLAELFHWQPHLKPSLLKIHITLSQTLIPV